MYSNPAKYGLPTDLFQDINDTKLSIGDLYANASSLVPLATITTLTTELNKTLAKLGNNVNEKTATNVETATSKVAKETKKKVEIAKSELEIYREELSKFEKELEELQFKRVRMPISKKEEDRIKDLTAQIQKMKDVLDSITVEQSKPVVEVAKSELEIYKDELSKLEKELEELQFNNYN